MPKPTREKLDDTRPAVTAKFQIAGEKLYLTVGLYEDGRPGEFMMTMAKQGSLVSGLVNQWAISVSLGLQHGVPLRLYLDKMRHTRFEPCRVTKDPEHPFCTSLVDWVASWLGRRFPGGRYVKTVESEIAEETKPSQ